MSNIKRFIRRLGGVGLGVLLSIQAGQAMAACAQADIGGAWQAYSLGYEDSVGSYWLRCTLQIKPNGVFDNTNSLCSDSSGQSEAAFGYFRLIGGQGCIFDGYIYLDGERNLINRATMNRSKDHVDGVGNFPGGIFFFNLTKP